MSKYDYLVVGAGLYGAVFAHEAKKSGKSVLVIDKRPQVAGNVYTEKIEGIQVHKYGAHIFHTNNKKYGNISHSLRSSTVLPIRRLRIITENCILFRLICTLSIRCGE